MEKSAKKQGINTLKFSAMNISPAAKNGDSECPRPVRNHRTSSLSFSHEVGLPKKKSKKNDETQELISLARKRLQRLENEFEKIASTWRIELQKMQLQQQLFAKKGINDMFFEGQLGTLYRDSVEINLDSSCTSTPYSSTQSLSLIIYQCDELQEQSLHTAQRHQPSHSNQPSAGQSSTSQVFAQFK